MSNNTSILSFFKKHIIPERESWFAVGFPIGLALMLFTPIPFAMYFGKRNDAARKWCEDAANVDYCSSYKEENHDLPPQAYDYGEKEAGPYFATVAPLMFSAFFLVILVSVAVYKRYFEQSYLNQLNERQESVSPADDGQDMGSYSRL